ncbi:MAG: hypothetical protein R3E79_10555 [Caldilineaceae bacterium]
MTDEEYLGLQSYLLQHPNAGVLIPKSGGVRKLRWATEGRGKRGGVRIIYYWKQADDEIWMITIYAKNEISTIPGYAFREIAEEIKNG